jgi:putative ABC transport system substrate-binding protein
VNNRRSVLIALGATALAPRAVFAQAKQMPVLIGLLTAKSRESSGQLHGAFRDGLAALGIKEGSQFVIEERWADGWMDRLPALAAELAAKRPAVIVADSSPPARAATKAAPGTPIVVIGGNPVAAGLAASLARPGGMVTGIASLTSDVTEKYLELLLAAAPKLRRIGFLLDSTGANHAFFMANMRRSVSQYSVEARFAEVARRDEVEPALLRVAKEGAQALVIMPSPGVFPTERRRILKFAQEQRWPVIAWTREWADQGALLSYGVDASESFRRAAYYVDRILKGAKPADMPIEQPTKIELVVNLKTAKALGLTISQPFLMRADKVIE